MKKWAMGIGLNWNVVLLSKRTTFSMCHKRYNGPERDAQPWNIAEEETDGQCHYRRWEDVKVRQGRVLERAETSASRGEEVTR